VRLIELNMFLVIIRNRKKKSEESDILRSVTCLDASLADLQYNDKTYHEARTLWSFVAQSVL
jgi:hypothetical protein